MDDAKTFTSFAGTRLVATGDLRTMLLATKKRLDRAPHTPVLIFDDTTGAQVEHDFRGTAEEVLARELQAPRAPGPGRPKLGVVSREVTLLPRHWEWLEQQPNGISAALRRLVEEARKREPEKERTRRARAAASRVMTALAGDLPGYEEATRALFAGDAAKLAALTRRWPKDVRAYVARLASA